jgi:glutamate transport system substrate-binding protein
MAKMRIGGVMILAAVMVALSLTACSDDSPDLPSVVPISSAARQPSASAAPAQVVVGTKVDQFGTGYLDVSTYNYSGLDVDIARYISSMIFHDAEPYIMPVSSNTREPALGAGAIKFFAATYTILPERQKKFRIAGPYLVTAQGVMLGPHSPKIEKLDDLNDKRVCVVGDGSNTEEVLIKFAKNAIPVRNASYSACLIDLRKGNVDAFSADLAILYGYIGDPNNRDMRVVKDVKIGNPIFYGIAFRSADQGYCLMAAEAIKEMIRSKQWENFFSNDLRVYREIFPEYQTQIQPTEKQITDNSCK